MKRRIRLGMVGGGQGGFIGAAHRVAARLDDEYQLVAGALSSDPQRARDSGAELRLDAERCYADYREMAAQEARRPDGIDVVTIVTPNYLHFPVAKAFLEQGIHVICDKPLTTTLADADELQRLTAQTGLLFMVTHIYSGYPLVRHARELVEAAHSGTFGSCRWSTRKTGLPNRSNTLGKSRQSGAPIPIVPARPGPSETSGRTHFTSPAS